MKPAFNRLLPLDGSRVSLFEDAWVMMKPEDPTVIQAATAFKPNAGDGEYGLLLLEYDPTTRRGFCPPGTFPANSWLLFPFGVTEGGLFRGWLAGFNTFLVAHNTDQKLATAEQEAEPVLPPHLESMRVVMEANLEKAAQEAFGKSVGAIKWSLDGPHGFNWRLRVNKSFREAQVECVLGTAGRLAACWEHLA